MNIFNLVKLFQKLAGKHHSFTKDISPDNMIGFEYDGDFKKTILNHINNPIINRMVQYGDLNLGLILKRIDEKMFDLWLEQFAKKYSPLGFPAFEDNNEMKYGKIFDNIAKNIGKN